MYSATFLVIVFRFFVTRFLIWTQRILDLLISLIFGYKTKSGFDTERKEANQVYKKSAQVVSFIATFFDKSFTL